MDDGQTRLRLALPFAKGDSTLKVRFDG